MAAKSLKTFEEEMNGALCKCGAHIAAHVPVLLANDGCLAGFWAAKLLPGRVLTPVSEYDWAADNAPSFERTSTLMRAPPLIQ